MAKWPNGQMAKWPNQLGTYPEMERGTLSFPYPTSASCEESGVGNREQGTESREQGAGKWGGTLVVAKKSDPHLDTPGPNIRDNPGILQKNECQLDYPFHLARLG